MLGTTTLMFAMGIAALVLVTIAELSNMRTFMSNGELPFSIVVCYYAWAGIACLMVRLYNTFIFLAQLTADQYMLCDVICAWRTVVIWNKDKRIIAILVIFVLGSFGT